MIVPTGGLVPAVLLLALATSGATANETFGSESAAPAESSISSEPSGMPSLMRVLARKRLHDLKNETWNVYGQLTYISSWKPSFPAAYTNLNGSINSLLPEAEWSFTATATLFVGLKLWSGGEAYFVPEMIAERPFSQLRGLAGAIQNFELQKTGGETRTFCFQRRINRNGGHA